MKKCWKRLKCDEDEEIYPNNSDNGYQNGEDLLSVPFYFKKEINYSIDKAVESRILTTKISTNEDYDSMAYSLGSDMVECKLDGFEIKNGLDKMREQFCNDISSCISHQKFDAKSKFDMKEEHDESRSKTKITTDEFDFESVFSQLLVQPDSKLLIVNDISNLNSKTNLNSTNVLMNNTMNDPKFKSKFTFLNEFQQSSSYEEKPKCLNELITLVSSCDQSSDSKNLKNILDSLQNNSPYICNSLHFINQSKLTENEIEDNNSLKRCIVQTPVSIHKISKMIEGFVESIAENPLKENKINTGSSILSNEKYEPLETNNLSNSCYEINQEVIVLEFQTRKKKMLDQTNLNKLLQKPSKHGSN